MSQRGRRAVGHDPVVEGSIHDSVAVRGAGRIDAAEAIEERQTLTGGQEAYAPREEAPVSVRCSCTRSARDHFRPAMTNRSTLPIRSGAWIGFAVWSWKPAASARARSSGRA